FEPRPTLLNGVTGASTSKLNKKNSLGFAKPVPQLADPADDASSVPTTVVTAIGWFPTNTPHDAPVTAKLNPFVLFSPPNDGSGTFTATEINTLRTRRDELKALGVRIQYHKTVVKP